MGTRSPAVPWVALKAIVDKMSGCEADCLISLKSNQSGFRDQAASLFERGREMHPGKLDESKFCSDWKKIGSRLERREALDAPGRRDLPGAAAQGGGVEGSQACVEGRARGGGGWRAKRGQTSRDARCFAPSMPLPPEAMAGIALSHWQAETLCEASHKRPCATSRTRRSGSTIAAETLEALANDFDYLTRALRRRPEEAWPRRKLRARKAKAAPAAPSPNLPWCPLKPSIWA